MSIEKGAFGGNSTWGLSTCKQIKAAHWQIDTLAKLTHIFQRGRKKCWSALGMFLCQKTYICHSPEDGRAQIFHLRFRETFEEWTGVPSLVAVPLPFRCRPYLSRPQIRSARPVHCATASGKTAKAGLSQRHTRGDGSTSSITTDMSPPYDDGSNCNCKSSISWLY